MTVTPARVMDLPLVEVPAAGGGDTLAAFYSGDGGWAGIDRGLADGLVQAGVPVIGYDSLGYFLEPQVAARGGRRPDRGDRALHGGLAQDQGGDRRLFLRGRRPADDHQPPGRPRCAPVCGWWPWSASTRTASSNSHPGDWLNQSSKTAYTIAPVLDRLKGTPGGLASMASEDKEDACPSFAPSLIRGVKLKGGHHFNGDYAAVGPGHGAGGGAVTPTSRPDTRHPWAYPRIQQLTGRRCVKATLSGAVRLGPRVEPEDDESGVDERGPPHQRGKG